MLKFFSWSKNDITSLSSFNTLLRAAKVRMPPQKVYQPIVGMVHPRTSEANGQNSNECSFSKRILGRMTLEFQMFYGVATVTSDAKIDFYNYFYLDNFPFESIFQKYC